MDPRTPVVVGAGQVNERDDAAEVEPVDLMAAAAREAADPRVLQAVDAIRDLAGQGGLSCAQLCIGTLLHTPGLTACIVGARDARQGAAVANLGVAVSDEQVEGVARIIDSLTRDLASL